MGTALTKLAPRKVEISNISLPYDRSVIGIPLPFFTFLIYVTLKLAHSVCTVAAILTLNVTYLFFFCFHLPE